ncbi:H-NS family nucleoid-associated regulatory protein [Paracoccus siganidrum]|uniref:H-NS histone family protein n=1 Tax=Paracoccus siganidrum TaxID=1276757 RepID=A0A419A7K5_9RHOB|nr:H-NS histone family protein [Paracoccus siganidrum]RJL16420.1 H-NS histone family protein [Paracoccus siganidrum]RMC30178.1 transcriptional regulator [Paracoccus siganidrum]
MANPDLDQLDLKELRQLQREVAKAIETYEQRAKAKALAELNDLASRHGFKLQELLGTKSSRQVGPKYRHPENPDLTWSGRGRQPRWISEALKAGKSLDDFAI